MDHETSPASTPTVSGTPAPHTPATTPNGKGADTTAHGLPEDGLPSALADELFSILSHELRAPLTTIKGSSRTLLRHYAALDADTARQLLTDIDHEADRLHRLIDNLLLLARAGGGASSLRTEPTALDVLVRRVVADALPRAGARRLRVRIPQELPPLVIDPVRIEQVLRNLVDNAVKFSPLEGAIDVSATVQSDDIIVSVKDDGPGVAPEYHHRVFERFFRVERDHSAVAGAGLGLAICKRFVELHGGRIELDSRPGHGATFRFTLPLAGRTGSSPVPAESSVEARVS